MGDMWAGRMLMLNCAWKAGTADMRAHTQISTSAGNIQYMYNVHIPHKSYKVLKCIPSVPRFTEILYICKVKVNICAFTGELPPVCNYRHSTFPK